MASNGMRERGVGAALLLAAAAVVVVVGAVVRERGAQLQRLLAHACQRGQVEEVVRLLARGARCNAESDDGVLPLVAASAGGRLNVVMVLLDAGASIDRLDAGGTGGGALLGACLHGHVQVVKALCERGASRHAFRAGIYGSRDLEATVAAELEDLQRVVKEHGQQAWNPTPESVEEVLLWLRANPEGKVLAQGHDDPCETISIKKSPIEGKSSCVRRRPQW